MSSVDNTPILGKSHGPLQNIKIPEWDKGTFAQELVNQSLVPRHLSLNPTEDATSPMTPPISLPPLPTGTFNGSQKAGAEMFRRIKERYVLIPNRA